MLKHSSTECKRNENQKIKKYLGCQIGGRRMQLRSWLTSCVCRRIARYEAL